MKKIIIYFPDTGGYNFTPPYEMLFQAKALDALNLELILCDSRSQKLDDVLHLHGKDTVLLIISTLIKYTSITISKQIPDGLKAAEKTKTKFNIPVLWTGLAPTVLPETILKNKYTDFILSGHSEEPLKQFIAAFLSSGTLESIPNLGYKISEKICINPSQKLANVFSNYGHFDLQLLDEKKYIHDNSFDYVATIGCSNHCSFCTVPLVMGRRWYHNDPDIIIRHLEYVLTRNPEVKHFHFRDDNFFVNKRFILELFDKISLKNLTFTWSAQSSVNYLKQYNSEDLQKLKHTGCNNISLGIESGDEFILEKVAKSKTDLKTSTEIIKKLLNEDISVSVTSLINFPYNRSRDYNRTLRFLMKLKLLYPGLSMYCTVLQFIPGTEIHSEFFRKEEIADNLLLNNRWISQAKRDKLKKFESFYFAFIDRKFYRRVPEKIGKRLRLINLIFYPFVWLRFKVRWTGFLWEYALTRKRLEKINTTFGITKDSQISESGIRHMNSKYSYGYKIGTKKS